MKTTAQLFPDRTRANRYCASDTSTASSSSVHELPGRARGDLSYGDLMHQACMTADCYLRSAIEAVAKARAEGWKIRDEDVGAIVAAYIGAAASDYTVHARIKFEKDGG
ncbi:hypothetical protein [Paraburkholderia saeva]|uniref:Uncharacterized protein n=1 Tax=Paraburkholderia saeva TaxID=2777537 RepID=A0A9N8X110_9BURK|nr:hypothetical protein [Paraburkholderia saeva]CAG4892239.1 hypothetical protein LMG31841_01581 [Paraburkholderia saeva]